MINEEARPVVKQDPVAGEGEWVVDAMDNKPMAQELPVPSHTFIKRMKHLFRLSTTKLVVPVEAQEDLAVGEDEAWAEAVLVVVVHRLDEEALINVVHIPTAAADSIEGDAVDGGTGKRFVVYIRGFGQSSLLTRYLDVSCTRGLCGHRS